jgi:ADP-heptose:LPS heptosyltransferase
MRILFVTSTRIGDAVLSTGLLDHLVRTHRGAAVTVVCGPLAAPLFEAVPGLERVIVLEKKRYSRHWLDFLGQTVGTVWDIVIDIRGSAATMALLRKKRHAYYTDRAPIHRVVKLSNLLGLEYPAAPRLWTGAVHEEEAATLVPGGGPVLAIGPTANWPCKEWAVENFIELAERLTAPGGPLPEARIMVLGAPEERETALPLIKAFDPARVIEVFGGVSLLGAFACLKRADFYVGNDSGVMHMAAAAGIPTLGLFGPTQDQHYAPFGDKCAFVRTPEAYEELVPPRELTRKLGSLMGGLTVDAVQAATLDLLNRTRAIA